MNDAVKLQAIKAILESFYENGGYDNEGKAAVIDSIMAIATEGEEDV